MYYHYYNDDEYLLSLLLFGTESIKGIWNSLIRLDCLASESQGSSFPCLPNPEITSSGHHTGIPSLGSRAGAQVSCVASTVQTELAPHPPSPCSLSSPARQPHPTPSLEESGYFKAHTKQHSFCVLSTSRAFWSSAPGVVRVLFSSERLSNNPGLFFPGTSILSSTLGTSVSSSTRRV